MSLALGVGDLEESSPNRSSIVVALFVMSRTNQCLSETDDGIAENADMAPSDGVTGFKERYFLRGPAPPIGRDDIRAGGMLNNLLARRSRYGRLESLNDKLVGLRINHLGTMSTAAHTDA